MGLGMASGMGTEPAVALAFLASALPVCLWAAWSDLSRMTIPNRATDALLVAFAVLGLLALPFPDYAWRWSHMLAVLAAGIALNALGQVGAGDVKFAAAAAPFVALADWRVVLALYLVCFPLAWALHRLARATWGPRLLPSWASWTSGKRFPMGLPLGLTLAGYLGLAAAA